ncbi:hypothetical protein BHM03_00048361, partial [Ensete ventricosum]
IASCIKISTASLELPHPFVLDLFPTCLPRHLSFGRRENHSGFRFKSHLELRSSTRGRSGSIVVDDDGSPPLVGDVGVGFLSWSPMHSLV